MDAATCSATFESHSDWVILIYLIKILTHTVTVSGDLWFIKNYLMNTTVIIF